MTPTKTRTVRLGERETLAQLRRKQQLVLDCNAIAEAINRCPGIESKQAIADDTGLTYKRVADCLHAINSNETTHHGVEYGLKTAKGGRYAGETRRGWFPMRLAAYHQVMDQADDRSAKVERGVRRSRLERLSRARGYTSTEARASVVSIEARLGVQIEELSETDLGAFEELLLAETD